MRARAVAVCNPTARCHKILKTGPFSKITSQSSPWPIQGEILKLNQGSITVSTGMATSVQS